MSGAEWSAVSISRAASLMRAKVGDRAAADASPLEGQVEERRTGQSVPRLVARVGSNEGRRAIICIRLADEISEVVVAESGGT